MSAWCDVWYETQDYQVACDSFSMRLSHIPRKILAFQLNQQDVSGKEERFHIPGSFPESPSLAILELNAPGFERIGQAFKNLHGLSNTSRSNAETPAVISCVRTKIEQSLTSNFFNIASCAFRRPIMFSPSAADTIPRLDPAQATTKSGSHQLDVPQTTTYPEPPTEQLCFVIRKCTAKEKLMSLDKLKLSNYVRSFDVQWNDIDDILEGEVVGLENDLPIISRLLVKGKDWSWRWIPAECVNQQLIQTYLRGRGESTEHTWSVTALEAIEDFSAEDEMVVYSVRQALRNGYPFRESGILNVARFVDLKDANKCAKRHFKTLCTPKTIKKVMKHRFGDMFFGSVANNDWKEEDVMVWVEKETRKKTVPDAFIQGFERAKSSVDNIANTVANPSSIGISSGAVLSADTDDNQAGITSDINPINQHVRDGRDFFGLVAAKKLHIDAGTLSGSLKKMEPLSPHEYFAQLDKRMNFIWRDWIKHWQNKTTKRFFGGKLQKDTATVPDSGEDASGEYSTNSHPLEGAHEVENGGSCVEVAVRDNPRAQVDAEYPNIENGQHNGEGVRKGSKTDIFLSKDEFRHAGSSGESEDDTRPILTPSSSVFGESAEVAKDEDKDGRFSEESGADSGPILTPSTSVFGEGSVRTEDESEDGESSEEAGDDRGTILTPSSVLGDDSVVAGEAAEDDGLREYSREGGSLLLTPTSSIFGDDGYLD